jgi:L-ascorbate metabolism protein UlaG (beta-lactamase superfamily)
MRKWIRKMSVFLSLTLVGVFAGGAYYLQQPKFGKPAEGLRLERMQSSPNYADGQFHNQVPTPQIVGESRFATIGKFLFATKDRPRPIDSLPTVKTDLLALDKMQDIVIWLGHSSYYLQVGGKRILIDPVLSTYAAPVRFVNKAFDGTNLYSADDIPEIDYLLISHDHWDHLDYSTVMALQPKIKNVVCGLGVGAYFAQWGFAEELIREADWFTELKLEPDFVVHVLPARHFSGRLLKRNQTLWNSFAIITPERRIFFSGDGGYGPHFKQIRQLLQGFDLAIMENGQYDKNWPYIHMMPEEVALATEELNAKSLLPGHAGKFSIANHSWDDPFIRINDASKNKNYRLLTPLIGEPVELENQRQVFSRWWEKIR